MRLILSFIWAQTLKWLVDPAALMFYSVKHEGCTDIGEFERVKVFRQAIFDRMNSPRVRNRVWMVSKVASGH